jgi:hypothetical protein
MGTIILGRLIVAFGAFLVLCFLVGLLGGHVWLTLAAISAGLIFFGLKLARQAPKSPDIPLPPVPPGFIPTFWHSNIALDMNAGQIFLRDENGRTGVFNKNQITGWKTASSTVGSDYVATAAGFETVNVYRNPNQLHLNNRLIVSTTDVQQPTWAIPFKLHGVMLSAELNVRDVNFWADRLNAFVRS